jgi:YVTN family beta-propeller protein
LALACLVGSAAAFAQNAYITNQLASYLLVIDTATNTGIATIPVGMGQYGVAVTPDGSKVYVTRYLVHTVTVIDTATNAVTTTIPVGRAPRGVAVTPDGSKVYVTGVSTSVIDTATDTVIATIPVAGSGVSVAPNGNKVFVVTAGNTVSVIDGDQHGDRPPDPRWQRPRSIRSIHWTAKICRDAGV